jgi:hypothetical protein
MTFKIKDKDIELTYTIRAMIMYENMTDKSFAPHNLTDIVTFMYCIVISSAKDYSITFVEFIDFLDKNPNAVNEFGEWLQSLTNNNNNFSKN